MLEIKNVCFERDNKKILDNINLNIDTDKFVAITRTKWISENLHL